MDIAREGSEAFADLLESDFARAMGAASKYAVDNSEQIQGAFARWTAEAGGMVLRFQTTLADFSANARDSLVSGFVSAFADVLGNVQSFVGIMAASFAAIPGRLYDAGVQAMSGLANGLLAGVSRVIGIARDIANTVASTVRDALDIASPSRVMKRLGKHKNLAAAACSPNAPDFIWSRFGDRTSRADVGLFDILNAERPADVYARRKDHEGGIVFVTRTVAAIASVYDLFTAGGPLYLRAPAVYGDFDFTIQPGDLQRSYLTEAIDQRHPFRLWTAPYTVVDLPLGPQQGIACATWCAVNDAFPTYADMTTAGGTWADLATGATVCP
jgi:hypothetical protein